MTSGTGITAEQARSNVRNTQVGKTVALAAIESEIEVASRAGSSQSEIPVGSAGLSIQQAQELVADLTRRGFAVELKTDGEFYIFHISWM